jgi:DnaJ-class molecular chaperone
MKMCPECEGSGEYGSKRDQFCRECNGMGYIE